MQVKFQVQSVNNCGLTYIPVIQFCAGNPSLGKDTCNVIKIFKLQKIILIVNLFYLLI